MNAVCFYFQVHQPWRLRKDFNFFSIGVDHHHEDDHANEAICRKVAEKCYIPTNKLMLELIEKHQGQFRISYAITGTALDQFEKYSPEVLDLFQKLVNTGCVEMVGETYHHSLAFLFSKEEFRAQVSKHRARIHELFGVTPTSFRNTELIYTNALAQEIENMGYKVILTEGADKILGWRSPNHVYMPEPCERMSLLLKNYRLSDDLAFRFSDPNWPERPLTAEKYAKWIHQLAGSGDVINLFMDYETFGEHQWAESGIFEMLRALPEAVLTHPDFRFMTPTEVASHFPPKSRLDVPGTISWADTERDTTAWLGNEMQDASAEMIYGLEPAVKASQQPQLIERWRRLLTSDHFYYMCTKWFADGDVHKYFNPYLSPHDAFVVYQNVLADLRQELVAQKLYDPNT